VTARLTDSGLLVWLDDAVPEKIVSINRLLPMRTRDDFIPMVALSLRRKQDNAHTIYQNPLTTINKKIAGDARCGKGLNSRSAVRFCLRHTSHLFSADVLENRIVDHPRSIREMEACIRF
jgi:hypothetical protein